MSYGLCYGLILLTNSVIRHRFQKPPDCFLITWCDRSVLRNKQILDFGQRCFRSCRTLATQNVMHVKPWLTHNLTEIPGRGIAAASFIVSLGALRNTKNLGNLILSQPAFLSLFPQSRADAFRIVQNFSFPMFTNALMCIILHSRHMKMHGIALCRTQTSTIKPASKQGRAWRSEVNQRKTSRNCTD